MNSKKYAYLLIVLSFFSNLILQAQNCPPISVGATKTDLCLGETATITATGPVNTKYTWDDGTVSSVLVVTPTVTTTYTVSSKLGVCLDTKTITIVVNPLPVISVNSGTICSGSSFTIMPSGASTYTISGGSTVVSPTVNSAYQVMGTSTAGCISRRPAICRVYVNKSPVVTVNSGSICAGQSFSIVPSGASMYAYSGGTNVVSPGTTTSYSVSGISAQGCISAVPAVSTVTVNPLPVIAVNSGSICAGQSFTMIPSGASTYTFSSGSNVVTPDATYSYSVTGTSAAGCVSVGAAVSTVTVNPLPLVTVNSGSICAGQSFTMMPSGAATYTFSSGTNVVSPATTTSYSVTGTSAEGCVSTSQAIASVTVNALPALSVNSGSICAGQSFTIVPTGAATYTVSCGSCVVSPLISSAYWVTGTSAEGCVSSSPAICNVTIVPLPLVYAGTDQNTYYVYGTTPSCTLLAGSATGAPGPYQYSWSCGALTQTAAVCPTVTTSYTLSVTAHGCTNSDIVNINVASGYCDPDKVQICHNGHEICVSQNAVATHLAHGDQIGPCGSGPEGNGGANARTGHSFSIYPNPNSGRFVVDILKRDVTQSAKIEILNAVGQVVFSKLFESGYSRQQQIEMSSELPAGIYFVNLSLGSESEFAKIILTK